MLIYNRFIKLSAEKERAERKEAARWAASARSRPAGKRTTGPDSFYYYFYGNKQGLFASLMIPWGGELQRNQINPGFAWFLFYSKASLRQAWFGFLIK